MLIRFSVENFMSFKERQYFSLIPGKGTLKSEHKTKPVKKISALKTAVIFGANASGKSNLIKSIGLGKKIVLRGAKPNRKIDYQKFRLDEDYLEKDSRLEYEIQHRGKNYAYGFVFNENEIVEEWLYEITKTSDKKIFERNNKKDEPFDLTPLFKKNSAEEQQFLKFIAKGTPDNQLFLTELRTRKVKENVSDVDDLFNVLDWFQNALKVVLPDDKYNFELRFELKNDEKLLKAFDELLTYFDTGISGVCLQPIDVNKSEIPEKALVQIKEDLLDMDIENAMVVATATDGGKVHFIDIENGELSLHKFMAKHKSTGKQDILFDMGDESDGTNRIIDFIPLLIDLLQGDNVFIIDEMERSLHPNLIYDLIDLFLEKSKNINSQLILASHESSLLTQKLLRKDEVWFTVKDEEGATKLHSLEEYNIRFDKQIRKDYLLGRFKAIPRIGSRSKLTVLPNS